MVVCGRRTFATMISLSVNRMARFSLLSFTAIVGNPVRFHAPGTNSVGFSKYNSFLRHTIKTRVPFFNLFLLFTQGIDSPSV